MRLDNLSKRDAGLVRHYLARLLEMDDAHNYLECEEWSALYRLEDELKMYMLNYQMPAELWEENNPITTFSIR